MKRTLFAIMIFAVATLGATSVTLISPYLPHMQKLNVSAPVTFQTSVSGSSPLRCTFYVEPNGIRCIPEVNCPPGMTGCTPLTYDYPTLSSGQSYSKTMSLNAGCEYLWTMTCNDSGGVSSPYQLPGFIYVNLPPPCTNQCSSGQKQCNGTQIMNCTLNSTSGCYYWKTSACPSGQTCQNGVCSALNAPPQITYFYPASGTTFDPPGPDKFGITAVDDRSTVMTCSVYYRLSGGGFSLLKQGQVANNTFTETRNSLLDSNPAYDHFTKNFTPGTYNYYFVCTDGEGLTAASPVAAGFGYYHTFYVRSPPCSCTNSTCGAYFSCGYRDAWSCVSGSCSPARCGDGFCNWCGFSPCASTAETTQNCPQDCGYACVNECNATGQTKCNGTRVQACGQYDSDSCLEWSAPQNCSSGQTCSGGSCISNCTPIGSVSQMWPPNGAGVSYASGSLTLNYSVSADVCDYHGAAYVIIDNCMPVYSFGFGQANYTNYWVQFRTPYDDFANGQHTWRVELRIGNYSSSYSERQLIASTPTRTFSVSGSNSSVTKIGGALCAASCTKFYTLAQRFPASGATISWNNGIPINYTVQAEACDYSVMQHMATFVIIDGCAVFDVGFFTGYGYGQLAGAPNGYQNFLAGPVWGIRLANGAHNWKVELRGQPIGSTCGAYNNTCMPILLNSTPTRTFTVTGSSEPNNSYSYCYYRTTNCTNQCSSGQTNCSGTQLQSCVQNASGCWAWGTPTNCPSGQTCSGGSCVSTGGMTVSYVSPTDANGASVTRNWSYVNVTASISAELCMLQWAGANGSMGGSATRWYLNKTGLAPGTYNYTVWCRYTSYSGSCGNGVCDSGETYANCPYDCTYKEISPCIPVCGDGVCANYANCKETCLYCPADCGNCLSYVNTSYAETRSLTVSSSGCTCTSYADCQAKLNSSSCTTVTLANDLIQGGGGTALEIYGNKIFDGGGHTINGQGGCGNLPQAGGSIDISGQNAKVRNLRMVDAVRLWVQSGGTGATIENVRLENTGSNSAILIGAPGVKVINTTIIGACLYGIVSDFYGVNLTDVSISGSVDSGIGVSRGSVYACRVKSCNNLGYTDISANTLHGVVSADRISVSSPGSSNYVNLSCSATNLSSYSSCFAAQCANQCSSGQTNCSGTQLQSCVQNASGCWAWGTPTNCPSGQACSGGACAASCTDQCLAGETRCAGTTGIQDCALNSTSGCYYWGDSAPCASGQNCQDGNCGTCPLITNLAPGNGSSLSSPVQFSMRVMDSNEADGFVDCALFVNGGQKTTWSSSSITGTTLTEQFAFANGLYQWNWLCRDSENCTSDSDTWDLWIGAKGCLSDSDCASGCCNFNSHACQSSCQPCNQTSDCPGGFECSNGTCSDCTGGNTCNPECASDPDCPANTTCVGEGGTIPVISNPPSCCAGLTPILPRSQDIIGISGICTAKCGNNVCDNATESSYNCPQDCWNESCRQDSVCVIGCANDPDCTDCPQCPRCPIDNPDCCHGVNCPEGETCINGVCSNCTQNGNCNPVCDGLDSDCACVSDASCPSGSICLAGYCTKCDEDNFCNPFCPAGADPDCGGGGGGTCAQDNVCVIGCANDPDCTDCPQCPRCPIENPNCCNGVNCPIGQTCIGGNCDDCSSNSACNPDCDGLDPDCSCTSSAQCPANSTCMGGYCTKCDEDNFCNPFCPAGADPDCGANVTGCVPECGQGYACVGSECMSCAKDGLCVSGCANDPDCCAFSSDCDAGETCEGGSCVPDSCVADGFCNQSCANDGDCCLGDGQCPTMGCPKGSDQDCCIAGDGCNELCANDPDCGGGGGGGGGGTCTECGSDGFCNLCCSPDPDCPPSECNGSSECGQERSCVNSRCVYTPLSNKSQKNENATYILIYAPANASLGSVIQLNVTFLNDSPASSVLVKVMYPDESGAQVITDKLGHAFFNATLPGFYYYDAFGVHVYMSMLTFVPSPGSPMNETPGIYVILNPGAHQKSLVLPVTISEPSALTLSVTDEVSKGIPSALNIKSPSESVMENETNDSGIFMDNYSELGKYTFTITAKREAERIFAKINLERMPLQVEVKNDWIILAFLVIIVLALVLAYFSKKGLSGLFAFGKSVKATIVPSKTQAGKEVEIVLEAGKELFANKPFYIVLKETNEMFGLETDKKGRATFVPQQKGRYVIQIEGYSVGGDRELVAE